MTHVCVDDDDEVADPEHDDDWLQFANVTSQFPVYVIDLLMVVDYAIYRRSTPCHMVVLAVTVTGVFILHLLLAHHKTIISLYPGVHSRLRQKCFSWRRKAVVDRSSFSSVGNLLHARGAATEKVVSPIRRRVCGTTRSPQTTKHALQIARIRRQLVSVNPICILTSSLIPLFDLVLLHGPLAQLSASH